MPDKEKIKPDWKSTHIPNSGKVAIVPLRIEHVPKDEMKPHSISVTVDVPMRVDAREFVRAEIAYLKNLMQKYPGPAERFYNEAKTA